jgi:predicted  nucleic acid-binding Zn-ribbon protein
MKKRREAERLAKEKGELQEDLKVVTESTESDEKKIAKLKRKYDKKLSAAREEIDELHEVSYVVADMYIG